jgi:hypothetical protein
MMNKLFFSKRKFSVVCVFTGFFHAMSALILLPAFLNIAIDVPMFFLLVGLLLNLIVGIILLVLCWSAQGSTLGKILRGVVALKIIWTIGAAIAAIIMQVASFEQLPYQIFTLILFISIMRWSTSLAKKD